jgi:EpsI family protein
MKTWQYHIAGIAMLFTAGITLATSPTKRIADAAPPLSLENIVPKEFGEWRMVPDLLSLQLDEERQKISDKIYDQLLMRTYINGNGQKVMFVAAYGGDQSDSLQVHKPEVCYTVQGYQIRNERSDYLDIHRSKIPVRRLVAVNGLRVEPITYWITVGNRVVADEVSRKLAQMRYGITGKIPDGMLVRVSNIGLDDADAYHLHAEFMDDLVAAIPDADRARFIGVGPGA